MLHLPLVADIVAVCSPDMSCKDFVYMSVVSYDIVWQACRRGMLVIALLLLVCSGSLLSIYC